MARAPEAPAHEYDGPVHDQRVVEPVSAAMPAIATVCGVVGLLAAFASLLGVFQLLTGLVALVLGVSGVILGALAWAQARRHPAVTNGTAIGGTVLSVVTIAVAVTSMAMMGAELRDLDATVDELEAERQQLGEQLEEGAEETADSADDVADEVTD